MLFILLLSSYIFTSLCSLRIILTGKNLNQVWLCVCSFIFILATGSSVVLINDIAGHSTGNQVWEDNSPQHEVNNGVQSIDYNTGQSMEEENKEANSQQTLNPITEGTIGSNTDNTKGSNTESAYAELSHSHLPGHTDLAVNCHDHEYGEIGGSINNVCSTLINQ